MGATGLVRRIDDLGSVVIPKELRRTLGVNVGDPLEVFTDNDTIILKKYSDETLSQQATNFFEMLISELPDNKGVLSTMAAELRDIIE